MSDADAWATTVREKLSVGAYKTKLSWPETPKEPDVLKKLARHLTDEEAASLTEVRAAFKAAEKAAKSAERAYRADVSRLEDQLRTDLEAEHGMAGHHKADLLWEKAWERGHSCGLSEVASNYEDLVVLAK